MTTRNIIPLALLSSTALALVMPTTTHAAGFVADAKVTLGLRNYYFNRNFLNQTQSGQGQASGWTQSFILDARSGYTQGTVGFGLDVLGLYSV